MINRFILPISILTACLFSACTRPDVPGGVASSPSTEELFGITYQINVYSLADSDGDGWGDLRGIAQHLDYLEKLGAKALCLSPIQKAASYDDDDVIDYYSINPKYGSEAHLKELIEKAKGKNIAIYLGFELNHSSNQNPWFQSAISNPESQYRDYYELSANPDAETSSPELGQWHRAQDSEGNELWYFSTFDGSMPDFNYGPASRVQESPTFKALCPLFFCEDINRHGRQNNQQQKRGFHHRV